MEKIGILAFNEACQRVARHCRDPYAVAYAKAGLGMTDRREIRAQALYILCNTDHWRGDEARMVKVTLREFSKE